MTIPDPIASDESFAMFCHRDIPQLDARQIWAERLQVEHELARRIAAHLRPRIVFVDPHDGPIDDLDWLSERVRRLRTEERRRRAT